MIFSFLDSSKETPRYERQLQNVEEMVMHTINEKKGVKIDKNELHKILDALYEWRIID